MKKNKSLQIYTVIVLAMGAVLCTLFLCKPKEFDFRPRYFSYVLSFAIFFALWMLWAATVLLKHRRLDGRAGV